MEKLLLAVSLLLPAVAYANGLEPGQTAPLYRHLVEINREWSHQVRASDLNLSVRFKNDQSRIATHLRLVEKHLRQRTPARLDPGQRQNRLRHLDVLQAYWQAGIFPTNHYHSVRRPYFEDDYGVLCAVGYLIWQDGQYELVNKIRRENNFSYIAGLSIQYSEINTWAHKNGFTIAELAWIQPAYPPTKIPIATWGNGGGLNAGGRINALAKDDPETCLFVAGSFSEIDGVSTNNIVAWDGLHWLPLGDVVVGEIFALEYVKTWNSEKLYVGGNFYLPGQMNKRNIASYDLQTKTWSGLQSGEMNGSVYTLHFSEALFVGGNFKQVDGKPAHNLAIYNINTQKWNDNPNNGFQTDGPVYAIQSVDPYVLIGGGFQQVYQSNISSWLPAPHLAYYFYANNEWTPLPNMVPPVRALAYFNGNVFTGHHLGEVAKDEGINVLKAGLWNADFCYAFGDSLVHGFLPMGNRLLAYGGLGAGLFIYGNGVVVYEDESTHGVGVLLAENTVRSMISFRQYLYLAGDFQAIFGDPFPGLARIQLPAVSTQVPKKVLPVEVLALSDRLSVRFENLHPSTQLEVFDLQGHILARKELPPGSGAVEVYAESAWADGLYMWRLQNGAARQTGKWFVIH